MTGPTAARHPLHDLLDVLAREIAAMSKALDAMENDAFVSTADGRLDAARSKPPKIHENP
jgi:hypothetical protein